MDPKIFVKNLEDNFKLTSNIFTDIDFSDVNIEPYNFTDIHGFGERDCLLYKADFNILNVVFSMKFLSFVYTKHGEILKLEISIHNDLLQKEVCNCRNFLQRKRNLNLTFNTLAKIAKLYEARRLICKTVLQKDKRISLQTKEDGGILITCNTYNHNDKLIEVHWTLVWNLDDCKISDFVEFYCNFTVLEQDCKQNIRTKLEILAKGDLDFHPKLKLWKSLLNDLYTNDLTVDSIDMTDVLEISDSESDSSIVVVNSTPIQESVVVLD